MISSYISRAMSCLTYPLPRFITLLLLVSLKDAPACDLEHVKPEYSPQEPHHALVIGNQEYETKKLTYPEQDACLVAKKLKQVGFNVTYLTNLSKGNMITQLIEFGDKINKSKGIVFFYFSGHGTEKGGINYLLPINNESIVNEATLIDGGVTVSLIRNIMNSARIKIVILDACRDDPLPSMSSNGGGLKEEVLNNTNSTELIAFATAQSRVAKDNGVYARVLSGKITLHKKITDIMMEVAAEVSTKTSNAQRPYYKTSLTSDYCFGGCKSVKRPPMFDEIVDNLEKLIGRAYLKQQAGDGDVYCIFKEIVHSLSIMKEHYPDAFYSYDGGTYKESLDTYRLLLNGGDKRSCGQ